MKDKKQKNASFFQNEMSRYWKPGTKQLNFYIRQNSGTDYANNDVWKLRKGSGNQDKHNRLAWNANMSGESTALLLCNETSLMNWGKGDKWLSGQR